jgi:hypothetical protein
MLRNKRVTLMDTLSTPCQALKAISAIAKN